MKTLPKSHYQFSQTLMLHLNILMIKINCWHYQRLMSPLYKFYLQITLHLEYLSIILNLKFTINMRRHLYGPKLCNRFMTHLTSA